MAAPESDIGQLIETAIANGVSQALGQMQAMPEFPDTGTASLLGQEEATFGGSIAQSEFDAAMAIFEDSAHSPGWGTSLIGKVVNLAKGAAETVTGIFGDTARTMIETPFNRMANAGVCTPDKAMGNMGEAFGLTTGYGFLSTGISSLFGLRVFGSGGLRTTGISAFLAKMGGWDDIFGQVWGPLMRGYVGQPMRYYINQQLMPFMPGAMDLMRMRYKRILPGAMNPAETPPGIVGQPHLGLMPGYEHFKKLMAYQGFSPEWSEIIENDLYSEPRYFELGVMGQNPAIPDKWWWEKCRRMGYNELDAGYLVGGIKNKIAGGYIQGLVNELLTSYREGMIGDDKLGELIKEAGIDDISQRNALLMGQWKKYREMISDETKLLLGKFSRDVITIEELQAGLDVYYEDPKAVNQIVTMAKISRTRRVYWTTERDVSRMAWKYWRQQFVAGKIAVNEYQTWAIEAGVEPDAISAMLDMDLLRRDQSVMQAFQRYGLPRLRDLVLQGQVSPEGYRSTLKAGGFPEDYLSLELKVIGLRLKARQEQMVRREELGPFEQAYVVGLVSRSNLAGTMAEAGIESAQINSRLIPLDYTRTQFEDRAKAKIQAEEERLKEEAMEKAAELAAAFVRDVIAARRVTEAWSREKIEQAKEDSRTLAAALISEVQRANRENIGAIRSLTGRLTAALWLSHMEAA